MAMTRIRVGLLSGAACLVGTLPEPKIADRQTGQVATDRETGATLVQLTMMLMEGGRAEVMRVTLPETGLPAGLGLGSVVRPVELFAIPWARIQNDQLQEGVAYRAAGLELVKAPAAQPAEAAQSAPAAAQPKSAPAAAEGQQKKSAS